MLLKHIQKSVLVQMLLAHLGIIWQFWQLCIVHCMLIW